MGEYIMKFKDRAVVFKTGSELSKSLGALAQNEFEVRETDIIVEFIKVDELINSLQQYKKLIVSEVTDVK